MLDFSLTTLYRNTISYTLDKIYSNRLNYLLHDGKKVAKGVIISADDADNWSEVKEEILTGNGYDVKTFSTIEDALAQFKHLQKQGIITEAVVLDNDTKTPMKGIEAAKEIRKSSPDTAIIILSGDDIPNSELQQVDAVQMQKSSFGEKELTSLVHKEIKRHHR